MVTDGRAFVVSTENDETDVEVDDKSSWGTIIVAKQVLDNQLKWYIPVFLYSRHSNGDCYMTETSVLIRKLCQFVHR